MGYPGLVILNVDSAISVNPICIFSTAAEKPKGIKAITSVILNPQEIKSTLQCSLRHMQAKINLSLY